MVSDEDESRLDQSEVTWRVWCEHDDCDWSHEVTEKNDLLAQRATGGMMAGHGIDTGHHETKREKLEKDR